MKEAKIRIRMSAADTHYAGGLVNGARVLDLFGDIATELLIRHDGDEGLFASYDNVKFLAPVYAGDYIEATGKIIAAGNTSRRMEFAAWKVITLAEDAKFASAAEVLAEPVKVAEASGTCVVPEKRQRKKDD